MENKFLNIYLDSQLKSKDQVYNFVCNQAKVKQQLQSQLLEELKEREKTGSIQISHHILMPHIESNIITQSGIYFIKFSNLVEWDECHDDVKMVIVLLIKKDEEFLMKHSIVNCMRFLADENNLNYLVNETDQKLFYKKINKIL